MGIDRERKQIREGVKEIAGIRTFMLFSLAGGLFAFLAQLLAFPFLFLTGLLAATALILGGYLVHVRQAEGSVGLTTEIAALIAFLLGGIALYGAREIAVSMAIITSVILTYREPIHLLVGRIAEDDIYAALKLLIATFIILPVLPDKPIDPWGALNLYQIWLLVILISGLSFAGYVCARWRGPGQGILVTGIFGGMVSSTAVALNLAKRSSEAKPLSKVELLTCGILLSWIIMFIRVGIEVAVVYPILLRQVGPVFLLLLATSAAMAWGLFKKGAGAIVPASKSELTLSNPFSLLAASKFAIFFALVLFLVKFIQMGIAQNGVYLLAALAGATDVDAITLSMAEYARSGGDARVAARSIGIAVLSNTAVKFAIVSWLGSAKLALQVAIAIGVISVVLAATWGAGLL